MARAPERILGYYVLFRISRQNPNADLVYEQKPTDFADEKFKSKSLAFVFKTIYDYLEKIVQAKRKVKRKISLEAELEIYSLMRHFVDKYFGKPEEPIDMEKVKKLAAGILEDLKKKGKFQIPEDFKK